jgi:hypothetical protein
VGTDFLEATMDGLGVPYEVVRVDRAAAQPLNFTQLLWNPDGSARYAGYFMCAARPCCAKQPLHA